MNIISLFSGAGGLDKGFEQSGFHTVWANEYDKSIWQTYAKNFPQTILNTQDIRSVNSESIPDAIGIIGGPPCQSWSLAGSMGGISDSRGKLFYEYLRILKEKKPLFFVAENVAGLVSSAHIGSFNKIIKSFSDIGYNVSYKLLNAADYDVPEDRMRVIIVGYKKDVIDKSFEFPEPSKLKVTLKDAISDLPKPLPAKLKNKTNGLDKTKIANHEYMIGGFSTMFMSRNRKRNWNNQSFTIQAGGRHAPLHPSGPPMKKINADKWIFEKGKESKYRRLSVRECARIQTFPDKFIFYYNDIADGYKMIGNAVPVNFAKAIAKKIMLDIQNYMKNGPANSTKKKVVKVRNKIKEYQA